MAETIKKATREAYGKALVELGGRYKDMMVLDADLSGSTKTGDFAKVYPERFFNAGIAEQNMTVSYTHLDVYKRQPGAVQCC